MKNMPIILLVLGLVASPVWAQEKLDKAIEKAYEKLEDGDAEDAVKELTKVTKDVGAPAYVALGKLQERLGHLEEAGAAYKQARQEATPAYRPEVLAVLANFTLRVGAAKEALALANTAVEAGETATTLAARARAQVRNEDGPGALASADKAVSLDASNVMAQVARGEALFALGRNADAETTLRKAVQLDPNSALAYSRLARVLIALGRPAEAVPAARKATELDPSFGEGFAILGGAILAQNQDNWGDAIAQAQQGAFLDPQNPIVQTIVGRIFTANGQGDQAVAAYRRALDADPGYAAARLALIEAELARGNRDAAIEEAKKAAADMPTSPEINLLLGEFSVRQNDYAAALGYLERAMKGMPGNADGWALLGRAYQFTKRTDDAAQAYAKAVELAPQNTNYRTTYGLLLGMTGDLDKGLEELEKVVHTPGYKKEDAWVNLGWVYRNMNKPEESIAAYKKALAINPQQEQAALGLGWAYSFTQDYDNAIAAYQQAVKINPEVAGDAYIGISWCYFFKREVDPAKEYMAKAASAKPPRQNAQLTDMIQKLEDAYAKGILMTEEQMAKVREQQRKEAETQQKLIAANNAARSSNPAARVRGARALAALAGAEAVDQLIYMMQTDENYDVRIAAANALGSLGRAARKAIPNLQGLLAQPPYEPPIGNATPEQLDLQMKDFDYRKAMQNALRRIQGG
jgi:tetratricopeptide (TPR) repeat protein